MKCKECKYWLNDGVSAVPGEEVGHCYALMHDYYGCEMKADDSCGMMDGDLTKLIRDWVSKPALYEQLAEELAEAAQAALKVARTIRGENPTPLKVPVAMVHLREEFTDVCLVADVIGMTPSPDIRERKMKRWAKRLGWRKEDDKESDPVRTADDDSVGGESESGLCDSAKRPESKGGAVNKQRDHKGAVLWF